MDRKANEGHATHVASTIKHNRNRKLKKRQLQYKTTQITVCLTILVTDAQV